MIEYRKNISKLDDLHNKKQISDEEYRWRYSMLQEAEIARKQRALMMYGIMQNQQATYRARQPKTTIIQPTYQTGTLRNNRTGETYTYKGTSQQNTVLLEQK